MKYSTYFYTHLSISVGVGCSLHWALLGHARDLKIIYNLDQLLYHMGKYKIRTSYPGFNKEVNQPYMSENSKIVYNATIVINTDQFTLKLNSF